MQRKDMPGCNLDYKLPTRTRADEQHTDINIKIRGIINAAAYSGDCGGWATRTGGT